MNTSAQDTVSPSTRAVQTIYGNPDSVIRGVNHQTEVENIVLNDKWDVVPKNPGQDFPEGKAHLTIPKKALSKGAQKDLTMIAGKANEAEHGRGDVAFTENGNEVTITMDSKVLEAIRGAYRHNHQRLMMQGHSKMEEQPGGGDPAHGLGRQGLSQGAGSLIK